MARVGNNPLGLPRRWLGPRRMCRVRAWGLGQAQDSQSHRACGFPVPDFHPHSVPFFSLSPSPVPEVCPLALSFIFPTKRKPQTSPGAEQIGPRTVGT